MIYLSESNTTLLALLNTIQQEHADQVLPYRLQSIAKRFYELFIHGPLEWQSLSGTQVELPHVSATSLLMNCIAKSFRSRSEAIMFQAARSIFGGVLGCDWAKIGVLRRGTACKALAKMIALCECAGLGHTVTQLPVSPWEVGSLWLQ
jgi:hypothetical protein